MMVISVVVVAVVGSSYAFIPRFQQGVNKLGYDIKETLATGSFQGQGRVNATVHDAATNTDTLIEGGEQPGTSIGLPFGLNLGPVIEAALLEMQRVNGGPPPTGIGNDSCGIWALSFIFHELGLPGTDMKGLLELARNTPGVLLSCSPDSSGNCTNYSIDWIGMCALARAAGGSCTENPHRGSRGDYAASKQWLESEIESGKHPAVEITDENGKPHWVVMTGVIRDPETGVITGYTYRDGRSGEEGQMSRAEFQESWAKQGNVALSLGAAST